MKSLFFAISTFIYNSPWNINIVLGAQTQICITTKRKVSIVRVLMDECDCPHMATKIAGVLIDEFDCPPTLTKCGLMPLSKITVSSWWHFSKYVVFPERQAYFTYGDLHSSGLKIYAFQLTILQCKKKTVTPTVSKCAYFQRNLNTFRVSS